MARWDEAFTTFVVEERTSLRRGAYLLCGDWDRAEDAVQIALAKLYVVWPRLDADGVSAYARRVLARVVVDEWRRPWRRRESPGLPTAEPPDLDAESQLGAVEVRSSLVPMLDSLPVRQRQVVVWRYWWGLSVAETAAELGIGDGTVKSHAARGLQRLAELAHLAEPVEPATAKDVRS